MAQVDFSNAIIEPVASNPPFADRYFGLPSYTYSSSATLYSDNTRQHSVATATVTNVASTLSKFSVILSGTFSRVGTEFYFGMGNNAHYKVSNISFAINDTFSFQVDVDISVS